ncbi:MAG: Bro-N domain-containing protein [Oscillospiraceae bacterium]|nr:Bro-N domain-containing protein [Oscillospiraceae bacterium]
MQSVNTESNIEIYCTGKELYFVGSDVAKTLGYAKPRNAIKKHVEKEDALKWGIPSNGGIQQTTIINESGLYSLVLASKLPGAKKFKHWVTFEVLPVIRRTDLLRSDAKFSLTEKFTKKYLTKSLSCGRIVIGRLQLNTQERLHMSYDYFIIA